MARRTERQLTRRQSCSEVSRAQSAPSDINGIIGNGPRNIPQVEPLGDAFAKARIRAAQLRQLELENQQRELQLEQQKKGTDVVADAQPKPAMVDSSAPDFYSFGLWNGNLWKVSSPDGKLGYVSGIYAGLQVESPTKITDYFAAVSFGEVVLHLDRFYQEHENALIPVAFAAGFVRQKISGLDPEDINRRIAVLRGLSAAQDARSVK
jgi:hypothetical protein